jgi:hypothetical protein
MKKVYIVDFSAGGEVVRGGTFANSGSLLYSAIKDDPELEVKFLEDITPFRLYRMPRADEYVFQVWGYGQIDSVKWAVSEIPGKKSFIGYTPFADLVELPIDERWTNENIKKGMANLPNIFDDLEFGLMSDCDLHIKSDDKRKVFPLFASAGCPNKCAFCPVPAVKDKWLQLTVDEAKDAIRRTFIRGNNIHFMDEDFFLDTKYAVELIHFMHDLQATIVAMGGMRIKWIALASVPSFARTLKELGEDYLVEAGLFLAEIGLESSNAKLRASMNKTGDSTQLEYILENSKKINKFWLTVTLFPGETITTLNDIGNFLKLHGTQADMHGDRLVTNGNVGGLGQFFQRYYGTTMYEPSSELGWVLEERPIRLSPSFIPNSLLECIPIPNGYPKEEELKFFQSYMVDPNEFHAYIDGFRTLEQTIDVAEFSMAKLKKFIIYLCLMARFGYLIEN